MLRFQDVLIPEGGKHGDRYSTIQKFSADSKIRPFRFDAITRSHVGTHIPTSALTTVGAVDQ